MQLIVLHQNNLHSVVYGNSYVECTVIRNNTSKPESFVYLQALQGLFSKRKMAIACQQRTPVLQSIFGL